MTEPDLSCKIWQSCITTPSSRP